MDISKLNPFEGEGYIIFISLSPISSLKGTTMKCCVFRMSTPDGSLLRTPQGTPSPEGAKERGALGGRGVWLLSRDDVLQESLSSSWCVQRCF